MKISANIGNMEIIGSSDSTDIDGGIVCRNVSDNSGSIDICDISVTVLETLVAVLRVVTVV